MFFYYCIFLRLRVVSRPVSASTSTGNKFQHKAEVFQLMLDAMNLNSSSSNGPKRNGENLKIPFLEKGFKIKFPPTNAEDSDKIIGNGGVVGIVDTQKDTWYKKEMGIFKKVSCEKTNQKVEIVKSDEMKIIGQKI